MGQEPITVKIPGGVVTLRKPKAGERNAALIKAETADGVKGMVFLMELLPHCIATHPWGATIPVKKALDELWPEDYDKIVEALRPLVTPESGIAKKSEEPSVSSANPKDST